MTKAILAAASDSYQGYGKEFMLISDAFSDTPPYHAIGTFEILVNTKTRDIKVVHAEFKAGQATAFIDAIDMAKSLKPT